MISVATTYSDIVAPQAMCEWMGVTVFPIKLYTQKQVVGWIKPRGQSAWSLPCTGDHQKFDTSKILSAVRLNIKFKSHPGTKCSRINIVWWEKYQFRESDN